MNYLSKSLEYNNFYIANEILSKEGIIGNDEINKLRFIDYNKNETTALIHATCKKQIEIVDKLLTNYKVNTYIADKTQCQSLHCLQL